MSDYSKEYYVEHAQAEVERLARALVELPEMKLEGECDNVINIYESCDNQVTISERCECGKMVEVKFQCDAIFDRDEDCEKTIRLEPDSDTMHQLTSLRLALVQLDLARSAEAK